MVQSTNDSGAIVMKFLNWQRLDNGMLELCIAVNIPVWLGYRLIDKSPYKVGIKATDPHNNASILVVPLNKYSLVCLEGETQKAYNNRFKLGLIFHIPFPT